MIVNKNATSNDAAFFTFLQDRLLVKELSQRIETLTIELHGKVVQGDTKS